jgi:hypothetical protein
VDDVSTAGASLRYLPIGVTVVALRPWPRAGATPATAS